MLGCVFNAKKNKIKVGPEWMMKVLYNFPKNTILRVISIYEHSISANMLVRLLMWTYAAAIFVVYILIYNILSMSY